MIGTIRRIHLLTVLALLLSGLLHSVAAAQGVTCTLPHGSEHAAAQSSALETDDGAGGAGGSEALSIEHSHDPVPQPDEPGAPAAPCGVAALPVERSHSSPSPSSRQLLPSNDLPPASFLAQSLYRPPRLS